MLKFLICFGLKCDIGSHEQKIIETFKHSRPSLRKKLSEVKKKIVRKYHTLRTTRVFDTILPCLINEDI